MSSMHIGWKAALAVVIACVLWAPRSRACLQFAELPAFNQPGYIPTGKCETCHAGSTGGPRIQFGTDWFMACRTPPGAPACATLCPPPVTGSPLPCAPVPWDDCSLRDADLDGDAYTNHEELLLGTNPSLAGDVDECALSPCDGIAIECDDAGRPARGDFVCRCPPGYEGDGRAAGSGCDDIDECDEQTDDCTDPNSECANVAGSWQCPCDFGFVGQGNEGLGCTQENFCEDEPCHPLSTCLPNVGGFECRACAPGHIGSVEACPSCPPGYAGDGIGPNGCVDVDECSSSNDCAPGVACSNSPGGRSCGACPSGTRGSSVGAEGCVRDVCSECSPFASCDPTRDPPCVCNLGFSGPAGTAGRVCEDVDECERGLAACEDAESCQNLVGSYVCVLATCATWGESCGESGRCDDSGGTPRCVCGAGLSGAYPACVASDVAPGGGPDPDAAEGANAGQASGSGTVGGESASGESMGAAAETCPKSAPPVVANFSASCSLGVAARGDGRGMLALLGVGIGIGIARRARSTRRRRVGPPCAGLRRLVSGLVGVLCVGACGGDPDRPLEQQQGAQCPAGGAGGIGSVTAGDSGAASERAAGGASAGAAGAPSQGPGAGAPSAACTHSRQCGAEQWCNPATQACQARNLPGEALTFRSDVFTVLETIGCPGCHSPGEPGDVDPSGSGANLLLDELHRGYASLVAGGVSCQGGAKRLCVDDPASSRLIRQVKEGESTSPESIAFTSWSEEPLQLILRWIARGAPRDSLCGNFVRDTGEGCDDGPAPRERCAYGIEACDVCTTSCQIGAGLPGPRCGDGTLDREAETCEPASLVSSEVGPFGSAVCGPDCVYVPGP